MVELVFPPGIHQHARKHLLGSGREEFGFFLAGVCGEGDALRFCVREFLPVARSEHVDDLTGPRDIRLETLLRVTNAAKRQRLALVEAHSHPFAGGDVTFSEVDLMGLPDTARYMLDTLEGRPYAATVWGEGSVDALYWAADGHHVVDHIRVLGTNLLTFAPTSTDPGTRDWEPDDPTVHRQVLAFGPEAQRRLADLRVGVVGLGGLGSHAVQQLAHLGVRQFLLVDPDNVTQSSLNRLVGARPEDVGLSKVKVARRQLEAVCGKGRAHIVGVDGDVRRADALEGLQTVDALFGCVDNDGARLVLNEIAVACYVPYFDMGTGIHVSGHGVREAGGRIAFVHPDGPCLLCMGEIDRQEAAHFLASPEAREQSRRLGYVQGTDLPSPSVVSLNGTLASMGVNEFLVWVTGIRSARGLTYYYLLEPRSSGPALRPRQVERDPDCYTCSLAGLGDRAELERYSVEASDALATPSNAGRISGSSKIGGI